MPRTEGGPSVSRRLAPGIQLEVAEVIGNDVVVDGIVVVELGCRVSTKLLTLASPQALIVPTRTSYEIPEISPETVTEYAESGSGTVIEGTVFVSSANMKIPYDEGSADVADSPDDHVTLIDVAVDVTEVIKGCNMGVVALPDGDFV